MRRTTFIDPEREAELADRGYTIVPILSEAEAAEALARVQALEPADGFVVDENSLAAYHCTFLDRSRDYRQAVDDLTRDLFEERTLELLDGFRMLTSNLYVKPPGTGRFEVHQNWPVTDDIRDTTLTLWCPFVAADEANGTIQVVPGSHKIVPDTFTVGAPKYFADVYDELIERWLEPVRLRPGECILFDDSLLHWSDENTSDATRWSAQLVFMPAEKTPVVYHYDQACDPPRFEVFEVGPEFFIDGNVEQLMGRPSGLPLVATVPARHLQLDSATFARAMELGPETRARVYAGATVADAWAEVEAEVNAQRVPDPPPGADGPPVEAPEVEVPEVEARPRRRRRWPFGR